MSEARMARASLKKTIAYATELLTMIGKDDELEAWIQSKISDMDHHIESIYSYYKFGDDEDNESEDSQGRVIGNDKHYLSMKDNDQSANLRALIGAGISSFKIEGRYKDLPYEIGRAHV